MAGRRERPSFVERCQFLGAKCQQQLHRTALARKLASDHILSKSTDLSSYSALVEGAVGVPDEDIRGQLLFVVIKTNFLLLKVHFEFFISRIIHCVWDYHLDELVAKKVPPLGKTEQQSLQPFARAVSKGNPKEYLLRRIIPSHGLTRMEKSLKESTGLSLPAIVNRSDSLYWPQIHSAFEVRHLVEHTNGRVDTEFHDEVCPSPLWRRSSWGKQKLNVGDEIVIGDADFDATLNAMLPAAAVIAQAVSAFVP
jgi:hypothetical protein